MSADTNSAANIDAAIALMQQGHWSEAQARLHEELADSPANARALRLLGTIYHLTGRADEAAKTLQRALEIDPQNLSTLINLGSVYLDSERISEAQRCFAKVIEIDPASADGYFNLGLAAQRTGQLNDAEHHYQQALEHDPDALDAAVNLAAVHLSQGQRQSCINESQKILARDPSHLQARLLLLEALLALNRLSEADHVLAQTPAPTVEHLELRALQGKVHLLNGRLAQAAASYRSAIALGDTRAQTALDLARCLIESGESPAAVSVLRALIEQDGSVDEYHELLGMALHDAGEPEQALLAYEHALQIKPTSVHYLTAKATLLFDLGRDDAAAQALDAAIASAPAIVSPHLLRVERLAGKGKLADALLACERYLEASGVECNMLAAQAFLLHATGRVQQAAQLMDYDALIATSTIKPPPGFADLTSFNAALTEHILAHPSLSRNNAASKATQHGQQSGNLLFGQRGPFDAFEQLLWQAAKRYMQELKYDPAHPFRAHSPSLEAVYAWAVVLERSGYQSPHIHPTAWLSGVYYAQLPAVVNDHDSQQGWIEFGAPPPEFVLDPPLPTRRIKPQEGLLVLFPSYFYHRTVPYESDETRISIAFDFSPAASYAASVAEK